MARRDAIKAKRGQKNRPGSAKPAAGNTTGRSNNAAEKVPYVKLLLFIGLILAFLYGPGLLKSKNTGGSPSTANVAKAPSKVFWVKKVAQFTGEEIQGKPFFANDIVAVGPDRLAITDNLGGQVIVCDFKGKLIRKWGKNGNGPKDLSEPSGIADDGKGHLFVLDTQNWAVKMFDLDGKLLHSVNLSHLGNFRTPRRLGFAENYLLVTDVGDARLYRLTLAGKLLDTWGEKGKGQGGSLWADCKAIYDGKGHYYIGESDQGDSLVRVFDRSGKLDREIKTGVPADSLGLDPHGDLFAVSYGDAAKVFDPNGDWLGYMIDEAQPASYLNLIAGIDILPDGMILTCGGNTVTIYKAVEGKEKQP